MENNFNSISFEQILTVCIQSPNNQKRKQQFLKLQKILPQLKAFPAIMGKDLTKLQLKNLLKQGNLDKKSICFSLVGEIGIYLSHLALLQKFVKSKKEFCLILEDDVDLTKNFKSLTLETLTECPINFDLLYLYAMPEQKKHATAINGKKYLLKAGNFFCCLAYLVSRQGATKIIQNIKPMRAMPIDQHFIEMVSKQKINAFITKKTFSYNLGDNTVAQKGLIPSIIQHSSTIKNFFSWQIFLRYIYLPYFFFVCIPSKILFSKWLPLQQYGIRKFRLWKLKK